MNCTYNRQMTLRLTWALQNVLGLREAAISGKAVFGGVDCWLLYKLTGTLIIIYQILKINQKQTRFTSQNLPFFFL